VEFCQRLLSQFKLRRGERKYLLKRVARCLLPKEIVGRTKKGFGILLAKWLREVPAEATVVTVTGRTNRFCGAGICGTLLRVCQRPPTVPVGLAGGAEISDCDERPLAWKAGHCPARGSGRSLMT
jgi:hypothetical protein